MKAARQPVAGAVRRHDLGTVIAAAIELFLRRGYDGTSMETIAQKLGVTKAALYYHAPGGKAEILQHAMERATTPLWQSVLEANAMTGTPLERLEHALTRQIDLVIDGLPEISFFLLPLTHHPLHVEAAERRRKYDQAMKKLFKEAAADGSIRADLDLSVLSRVVLGVGYSVNEWFSPEGRLSRKKVRDTMLRLVFEGIRPERPSSAARPRAARRGPLPR